MLLSLCVWFFNLSSLSKKLSGFSSNPISLRKLLSARLWLTWIHCLISCKPSVYKFHSVLNSVFYSLPFASSSITFMSQCQDPQLTVSTQFWSYCVMVLLCKEGRGTQSSRPQGLLFAGEIMSLGHFLEDRWETAYSSVGQAEKLSLRKESIN